MKKDELKKIEVILRRNLMNDLICVKLIISVNILCLLFFLKDIHEGHLSLEDADDERSNCAAKIKNLEQGKKNKNK